MADTVLVNIGDIMQRWTSDKLTSTVSGSRCEENTFNKKFRLSVITTIKSWDDLVLFLLARSHGKQAVTHVVVMSKRYSNYLTTYK